MPEIFNNGTTKLLHGNCLDELATIEDQSVDLVLTDPPYGLSSSENLGMARKVRPNSPIAGTKGAWDQLNDEEFVNLIGGFLEHSKRILRPGGTIAVFCSHHQEDAVKYLMKERFEYLNRIIAAKSNPSPLFVKTRLVWSYESIFVFRNGAKNTVNWDQYPYAEMFDVWKGPICQGKERVSEEYINEKGRKARKSIHPTQKPLWLMEKLVKIFSNPGDLIVDPFVGVASTCVAAQKNGRNSIGIDMEERYLCHGIERL